MFGAAWCARGPAGAGLPIAELLVLGTAEDEPDEDEPDEDEPAGVEPAGVEVVEAEPAGAELDAGTLGLADGSATAEGPPAAMVR